MRASTDARLEEWDLLRRAGVLRIEAARRLGLRLTTFERMLYRHQDDPRARLGQRAPAYIPARDPVTGRWAG